MPSVGGGAAATAVDPDAGDCAPSAAITEKNADELKPAARMRLAAAGWRRFLRAGLMSREGHRWSRPRLSAPSRATVLDRGPADEAARRAAEPREPVIEVRSLVRRHENLSRPGSSTRRCPRVADRGSSVAWAGSACPEASPSGPRGAKSSSLPAAWSSGAAEDHPAESSSGAEPGPESPTAAPEPASASASRWKARPNGGADASRCPIGICSPPG